MNRRDTCGCQASDSCGVGRRQFVQSLAAGVAAIPMLGTALSAIAGPFEAKDVIDHFVPADKKLDPAWLKALFARGEPTVYREKDLKMIAMPVGGICAGQIYLTGDGRLTHWDIFNGLNFTGYGSTNYATSPKPVAELTQGFVVQVKTGDKSLARPLHDGGFSELFFRGEYPIGRVEYADPDFPVAVTLEAFSPFIPLAAADSALPATVMQFTVKNRSKEPVEVTLSGSLENGTCHTSSKFFPVVRRNRLVRRPGLTMIQNSAEPGTAPKESRPPIVLADFEGNDYGAWTVEGTAFGTVPARGALPNQQPVTGFQGKGLANSYHGGDAAQGRLTSPPFKIERNFLSFLIGGGKQPGKGCINLLIDGKVVHTATGNNDEKLVWCNWDVRELAGKEARIEIVDHATGSWGHITVDQIELVDQPRNLFSGPLEKQPDFGTMGLALLGDEVGVRAASGDGSHPVMCQIVADAPGPADAEEKEPYQRLCGVLHKTLHLEPGAQAQVSFVIAWHFPNRPEHGNFYATRFQDAASVAQYIADNFQRLAGHTRLWRDTWYDSSLPYWLLDRLFSTVSILASGTCQWWANGRFWAWEGVGCCEGTCAHVWNYEHAMARLFPDLERAIREMQDFGVGFVPETGAVRFRGEGWPSGNWPLWAGDAQGGTVLKAYREHLCSTDGAFLRSNWRKIRKSLEFLIAQDTDGDGLIKGAQHNTYDINFFGPNTLVGALYLGALRAGEEMAKEMGAPAFAALCRKLFTAGSANSVKKLFNGEYFIQQVDLKQHPRMQYVDGCLADQLFGQSWAHQVALGYLYPQPVVRKAMESIWKYDWAPDVGPQDTAHPPQRWFARPGEAGLLVCTWPKSKHPGDAAIWYRDEVWTGIEYQVAAHMVWEGMLQEGLAICRGIHERYHPARHNPWNEVECGDHYARAMASYGVFLALCGFQYHGPQGRLGFAPRMTPENFRAAFTAADGWGALAQQRKDNSQLNRIELKWGHLRLKTLTLELPAGTKLGTCMVTIDGRAILASVAQDDVRLTVVLAEETRLGAGNAIELKATYGPSQ